MNTRIAMVIILFSLLASATVYDGDNYWKVYDNKPIGATIESQYDAIKKKNVVLFEGDGQRNAYIVGSRKGKDAWKNHDAKIIKWNMNFKEKFKISIFIETAHGDRILLYYSHPEDRGPLKKRYIRFGLGYQSIKGNWVNIERNLEKDLKKFEPNNDIVAVNGFKIQGSGKIEKIELLKENTQPKKPSLVLKNKKVYANAANINTLKWKIKSKSNGNNTPTITTVFDNIKNANVIKFKGNGRKTSYFLGAKTEKKSRAWNDTERHIISWQMKSSEKYNIKIYTKTKNGYRNFYINHRNGDRGLKNNKYIYLGMGSSSKNGTWKTFTIDLEKMIKKYEPNNQLLSVNGIKIQGSMEIDNILLGAKKSSSDNEFLKLALSNEKYPQEHVTVYRTEKIAFIFTNPRSIYAKEHMGLTKVDIRNPKNLKSLGYNRDIFKVYKGYRNTTLMPTLINFEYPHQGGKNFIFKKDNSDIVMFATVYLDEKTEEEQDELGGAFLTVAKETTLYTVRSDLKPLKILSSLVSDEKQDPDGEFPQFRIIPVNGIGTTIDQNGLFLMTHSDTVEGFSSRVYHISKSGELVKIDRKLSIYDNGRSSRKYLENGDIIKIVEYLDASDTDDNKATTIVREYDGTKLPSLVKIVK